MRLLLADLAACSLAEQLLQWSTTLIKDIVEISRYFVGNMDIDGKLRKVYLFEDGASDSIAVSRRNLPEYKNGSKCISRMQSVK